MRTLLIIAFVGFSGMAQAAERKAEVLVVEKGSKGSFLITSPRDNKTLYTGSKSGNSIIITDPRSQKTIAVIPRGKN
jgi:hypothetical protein